MARKQSKTAPIIYYTPTDAERMFINKNNHVSPIIVQNEFVPNQVQASEEDHLLPIIPQNEFVSNQVQIQQYTQHCLEEIAEKMYNNSLPPNYYLSKSQVDTCCLNPKYPPAQPRPDGLY